MNWESLRWGLNFIFYYFRNIFRFNFKKKIFVLETKLFDIRGSDYTLIFVIEYFSYLDFSREFEWLSRTSGRMNIYGKSILFSLLELKKPLDKESFRERWFSAEENQFIRIIRFLSAAKFGWEEWLRSIEFIATIWSENLRIPYPNTSHRVPFISRSFQNFNKISYIYLTKVCVI